MFKPCETKLFSLKFSRNISFFNLKNVEFLDSNNKSKVNTKNNFLNNLCTKIEISSYQHIPFNKKKKVTNIFLIIKAISLPKTINKICLQRRSIPLIFRWFLVK